MTLSGVVIDRVELILILLACLAAGVLAGMVIIKVNSKKAKQWGEKLDSLRKIHITAIKTLIEQQLGRLKTGVFIFGLNLMGGSLLQFTIGGIIVILPFLILFYSGVLVTLVGFRYPERFNWIFTLVCITEFGAYIIAAAGGVSVGLSIFAGGNILLALREWALLFAFIVVPLQIVQAFSEAFLIHRVFIKEDHKWPHDI